MSSYNNIRKIKYTKDPADIVSLQEYILFEDAHAEEKFIVFKFANNLNQRLYELKFEVMQYDGSGELLEKSVVLHENFVAEPNAPFVPNAKLQVNFACESIGVSLIFAAFDRVKWEHGEFRDNSYRFENYANDVSVPQESKTVRVSAPPSAPPKKLKYGFSIRNIFRKNRARFPAVFNVIACILVIAFVIATAILFRRTSDMISLEGFDLERLSDGYVNLCGYDGAETELTVPEKIGEYTVNKIAQGAFKNSSVVSVEIEAAEGLCIEKGAFEGCKSLRTVSASIGSGTIYVMENAFISCTALRTVDLPTARLSKNSFYGSSRVNNLSFYGFIASEAMPLKSLFGSVRSMKFQTVEVGFSQIPDDFFEDVTVENFVVRGDEGGSGLLAAVCGFCEGNEGKRYV